MDYLIPLGILGCVAIIIFIILYQQGRHNKNSGKKELKTPSITLFGVTISVVILVYCLRIGIMFITGLTTDFVIPTIITGGITILPLLFLGIITKQHILRGKSS